MIKNKVCLLLVVVGIIGYILIISRQFFIWDRLFLEPKQLIEQSASFIYE